MHITIILKHVSLHTDHCAGFTEVTELAPDLHSQGDVGALHSPTDAQGPSVFTVELLSEVDQMHTTAHSLAFWGAGSVTNHQNEAGGTEGIQG